MTMLFTLSKLDLRRLLCLLLMVTGVKLTRNTYREELLLLVSFDGFRWDYLERDLTPTLNDLAKHGSRGGYIINPFATKTLPSHFTTVTGLYEESHGLVGTKMYDPVLNETFHRNNTSIEWWSQTGQEPIWITNQRQGGSSAVIEYPGMDVSFGGMRPDYEYSHFSYSVPFDKRSDFAVSLLANGSINFAAIYFHEPDLTGHQHGPDSFEMNDTLKLCDNTVKHLMKELKKVNLLHEVNIIFTSDHGMISVDKSRTIYAENYLNDTIYPHFTTEDNPVLSIWPRKGKFGTIYCH
ncbi:hypothetical protein BSL78_13053 [Apostichopus japonicus]|uniref:Ectonucleotide pyrophosphatase/phosphodiesterase family member 5 n=1 Tax=Stichopus japonicus TaxID=307972 RepID=A0A2G8KPV4_STIJA|nr:hypothetical protein BSL78_13053 [Apostichopus japonicus]